MNLEDDDLRRRLAQLPVPRASEDVRSQIHARFLAGNLVPAASPSTRNRVSARRTWLCLAAAALFIAIGVTAIVATHARLGRWTILEGSVSALRRKDGTTTTPRVADELSRLLQDAQAIVTADSSLRFELRGVGRFELGQESELALVSIPPAETPGEIVLELRSGALRVITDGELAPLRMRVRAPDGEVLVVGTEFAIDILPGMGTCICCTRGAIEVESTHLRGDRHRIVAGGMALCPPDGHETMTGDVKPAHVSPIEALRRVER